MLSLVLVLFKFYFPFFGVFIFEFVKFYFVRRSLFEGKMRYCCWDFFFSLLEGACVYENGHFISFVCPL